MMERLCFDTSLSACPHLGGTPARSRQGGYPDRGYPDQRVPYLAYPPLGPGQGVPPAGGTPPWVPPLDLAGGYPTSGTPCWTWLGGCLLLGVPHLGYPLRLDLARGVPPARGVPYLTYTPPPSDLARGLTPSQGVLHLRPQVPPPHIGPGLGGTPNRRYPTSGTPPWTWPGGRGNPPRVVLDTPRSVCLLRSSRRTFLFSNYLS